MNFYDFAPIRALITAANWLVTTLGDLITPLAGVNSAGIAVILLTLIVRTLLIPVGRSQVRATVTRQRLAPKIAALQAKHRDDKETLQRELVQLYADEKASPMAGCLPVLLQAPVLMAVYGLFIVPTIGGAPNALLTHTFLGAPLGQGLITEIQGGTATAASIALHLAIMVVIAVVAQATRTLLTPVPSAPSQPASGAASPPAGVPDLSSMTRMLGFLPFMTVVIAAFVPLAAALYLMTTTSWTFCERMVLNKRYGIHRGQVIPATD